MFMRERLGYREVRRPHLALVSAPVLHDFLAKREAVLRAAHPHQDQGLHRAHHVVRLLGLLQDLVAELEPLLVVLVFDRIVDLVQAARHPARRGEGGREGGRAREREKERGQERDRQRHRDREGLPPAAAASAGTTRRKSENDSDTQREAPRQRKTHTEREQDAR